MEDSGIVFFGLPIRERQGSNIGVFLLIDKGCRTKDYLNSQCF